MSAIQNSRFSDTVYKGTIAVKNKLISIELLEKVHKFHSTMQIKSVTVANIRYEIGYKVNFSSVNVNESDDSEAFLSHSCGICRDKVPSNLRNLVAIQGHQQARELFADFQNPQIELLALSDDDHPNAMLALDPNDKGLELESSKKALVCRIVKTICYYHETWFQSMPDADMIPNRVNIASAEPFFVSENRDRVFIHATKRDKECGCVLL